MTLTSPTSLLINNQGTLDLIKSGQINDYTKHINIKFRHVCNQEDQGTISSRHVATQEQIADIMTKPLGTEKFSYFREYTHERSSTRRGVEYVLCGLLFRLFSSFIISS